MITNDGLLGCIILYNALCTMHARGIMYYKPCEKSWELLFACSCHNCLVIVTSSTIDCDVMGRMQTGRVVHGASRWRSSFLTSFMDSSCHLRNKLMYIPSWRTAYIYIYTFIHIGGESRHMDMATQGFMLHGCSNRQATCIWTCNHRGKI